MFSLVLFGGSRLATIAVSDACWPVRQVVGVSEWGGVGWGSVHWVPHCCGPLGVSRWPHSAALPLTWPSLSLARRQFLQHWPITALRHTWRLQPDLPPLDPAVVLPSLPSLSFSETKITLAGRCYSHISGIFASVLLFIFLKRSFYFIFSMCYIVIFVYMQWSTKFWLLN